MYWPDADAQTIMRQRSTHEAGANDGPFLPPGVTGFRGAIYSCCSAMSIRQKGKIHARVTGANGIKALRKALTEITNK